MPYIPCGSLAELSAPTTSDEVLASWQILRGVMSTLAGLHERKVVHRDVKPSNMLTDEENRSYLIDFADASYRFRIPNGIEWEHVRGSLGYVSPERLRGSIMMLESDTYSLGVSMLEVLTGKHPFLEHQETAHMVGPEGMYKRITKEKPQLNEDKLALVPPEILELALAYIDPHATNRPPVHRGLKIG